MRFTRRAVAKALGFSALAVGASGAIADGTASRRQLHVRRYAPALASDGKRAILSGGAPIGAERNEQHYYSSLLSLIETIDPASLDHEFVANGLFRRANHAALWLDDHLWLLGGRTRLGTDIRLLGETERVDLDTEAVWRGPDLPLSLINLAAVAHRGSAYVFGGIYRDPDTGQATVSDRVFECSSPYERWRERSPMPLALGNCVAVTVDDLIYLIGGFDRVNAHAVTQVYDPKADRWREGPPPPQVLSAHAGAAIGGRIYTFGDYAEQSSVLGLDPVSGNWRELDLPFTPRRHVRAVAVGDRVVVAGGNQTSYAKALGALESYPKTLLAQRFDDGADPHGANTP